MEYQKREKMKENSKKKLVKGSKEAKEFMAKLRQMKKEK